MFHQVVLSEFGSCQVVEEIVSNVGVIEKLTFFEHKDANGKDWGLNVRQRAKELVALVSDMERIRAERHKVSRLHLRISHGPSSRPDSAAQFEAYHLPFSPTLKSMVFIRNEGDSLMLSNHTSDVDRGLQGCADPHGAGQGERVQVHGGVIR
jgi:hypothetical protein